MRQWLSQTKSFLWTFKENFPSVCVTLIIQYLTHFFLQFEFSLMLDHLLYSATFGNKDEGQRIQHPSMPQYSSKETDWDRHFTLNLHQCRNIHTKTEKTGALWHKSCQFYDPVLHVTTEVDCVQTWKGPSPDLHEAKSMICFITAANQQIQMFLSLTFWHKVHQNLFSECFSFWFETEQNVDRHTILCWCMSPPPWVFTLEREMWSPELHPQQVATTTRKTSTELWFSFWSVENWVSLSNRDSESPFLCIYMYLKKGEMIMLAV